jgi:hypothetical protein
MLLLNWTGGIAPYQVQRATNLADAAWQNFGTTTTANSISAPATNGTAFYRIYGQ